MPIKTIVFYALLVIFGLNVISNMRKGFRTKMKGYFVRALINLSIVIELVLLALKLNFLFFLVLGVTIVLIVMTSHHVHGLKQHEKETREKK